ncbi:MAG: ABC transporter ATP-binding protein [Clostridia bacterium]|nr:ABC transporter ATP-binding protein [Clostridia bacterium]
MGPPKARKGTLGRLLKTVVSFYPVMVPVIIVCIMFNAVVGSLPSFFMQKVVAIIEDALKMGTPWKDAAGDVISVVSILIVLYVFSLAIGVVYNQLGAIFTQGVLKKMRCKMFDKMQTLPVKFFDTHNHGDVMSTYTNDIDTLRQLISQSIPQLMISGVTVLTLLCIMLYFSVWMTLVVLLGAFFMTVATKKIGGGSAKYFVRQQKAVGKMEGFAEEMMHGQKVVKVFCHEEESKADFDRINDALCAEAEKANKYANILGPVLNNLGNILYVVVAIVGGIFMVTDIPNPSISGMAFGISLVVPFLNITKQFSSNINQVSNQINSIVMGLAGADRIFTLLDEESEHDDGYVTLVNVREENGELIECEERTEIWAWKHPHSDGTLTYTRLRGDVVLDSVDFAYVEGKNVLHDVSIYAKPGQKVAFVGATGAGKTTITNLLNRFYDIADGKVRYDGINVNKIKKSDLRRALGIILQDTNLFTGTVMDNIRYGKLDATDEECIAAATLAGADDFITRLPEGYATMLTENGANLSQGQRQLLSIARAAVADPPVMIMDEATSSIDTRTEAIVQRGMDALMHGRTVFVIAHRLSTVKNSDVIIVLDHGRIIERGSHDDLIAARGQYYRLYTGAFELE